MAKRVPSTPKGDSDTRPEHSSEPIRPVAYEVPDTEVVLALVAAAGTDLKAFTSHLECEFQRYGYKTNIIQLSKLIREDGELLTTMPAEGPEFDRITTHMDAGNELRKKTGMPDWLALRAGPDDQRDFVLGYDTNRKRREEIIQEVSGKLRAEIQELAKKCSNEEEARGMRAILEQVSFAEVIGRSAIREITEYGRAVHAEMEALLCCARTGRDPRHGTLYATLFPCHNCARHIVAAGIRRVVYVEPYPKSMAFDLHADSMTFSPCGTGKVVVEPFVGIGPRRYFDLFAMTWGSGYSFDDEDDPDHARKSREGCVQHPNRDLRIGLRTRSCEQMEKILAHSAQEQVRKVLKRNPKART